MKEVHITTIKPGDTIKHNGVMKTVCSKDIRYSSFMGVTIFGDSYSLGHTLVQLVDPTDV